MNALHDRAYDIAQATRYYQIETRRLSRKCKAVCQGDVRDGDNG
jgi:hypothetical protein